MGVLAALRSIVEAPIGSVDERDGHLRAVVSRGPSSLGPVPARVEPTEDGLALPQPRRSGGHVVVVDGAGCDQRGVLVTEDVRLVLGIGTAPHGGGRLRLVDRGGGATLGVNDPDAGLAVLSLVDHQMIGEGVDGVEPGPRAVGDDLAPGLAPRLAPRPGVTDVRRLEQPEVLRLVVGHDQEAGRPGGRAPVVVDAVLDPVPAGGQHREGAGRVVRPQGAYLGRELGVQAQQDVLVVPGSPDPEVEVVVRLLVDKRRLRWVGSHHVAPELKGSHGLVHPDEEDGGVVVGPSHAVGGVLERLGRLLAGLQVQEAHGEPLGPGRVGRVGEPTVVRADAQIAEGEVVMALRQLVLVEHDDLVLGGLVPSAPFPSAPVPSVPVPSAPVSWAPVFWAPGGRRVAAIFAVEAVFRFPSGVAGGRPAAMDAVTLPLDGSVVVEPRPLAHRNGEVGLFDALHDLLEQVGLELGGMGGGGLGEGVLGPKVLDDLGVVLVPQPVPVVDPHVPVGLEPDRPPLGDRRG